MFLCLYLLLYLRLKYFFRLGTEKFFQIKRLEVGCIDEIASVELVFCQLHHIPAQRDYIIDKNGILVLYRSFALIGSVAAEDYFPLSQYILESPSVDYFGFGRRYEIQFGVE